MPQRLKRAAAAAIPAAALSIAGVTAEVATGPHGLLLLTTAPWLRAMFLIQAAASGGIEWL
jgi:hypothetical protein